MKRSFVLYCDYEQHLSLLTMEQRGVLFTAIMSYQNGKDVPEMDNAVAMAFSFIKSQLSRDNERYDEIVKKRSEAGKMGGRFKNQIYNLNSWPAVCYYVSPIIICGKI